MLLSPPAALSLSPGPSAPCFLAVRWSGSGCRLSAAGSPREQTAHGWAVPWGQGSSATSQKLLRKQEDPSPSGKVRLHGDPPIHTHPEPQMCPYLG